MHGSHPSDPKGPKFAPKITDDPVQDRPEDRRTLEMRGRAVSIANAAETGEAFDERDTAPPPIPVAEYVQAMMQQADTHEEPSTEPPSSRVPPSFRGEPPSSRGAQAFRGEPRAPHAWRTRPQGDVPPPSAGLRPMGRSEKAAASRSPPVPPRPATTPSSGDPRSQPEDEEFQRRPLSLRGAEPPRAPMEPDPWLNFELLPAGAEPSPPAPRAAPRTPPPPAPKPPPARTTTPVVSSKPPLTLSSRRLPNTVAMPAVSPGRPLPPPPVPKGALSRATPATVPRLPISSLLGRRTPPVPARPVSDPVVDAELDSLPFDDLVAASNLSSLPSLPDPASSRITAEPPTVVAPVVTPRAPVPAAGLRLGKQPLSSFPPVLDEPPEETNPGAIPPILDVAWAFNSTALAELDQDEGDHRDAVLPGSAPGSRPPGKRAASSQREADSIPPILDAGWAFPRGTYDESNEVTTTGSEDELQPVDELQARLDEGDYAGALLLAERLLALDPADERASRLAESAREQLVDVYSVEIGGRRRIPHVIMDSDEIRWLALDHRAGFLLSCIDGRMSIEEVLDVSGMPALDALRILCDLRDQSVIALDTKEPPSTRR
jgi:hypothetical protein